MDYRKTKTIKGIDYYRIDLESGDQDPDFEKLPEHWQEACWDCERDDRKSNRTWPDPFYSKQKISQDKNYRMTTEGSRLVNGIYITWDHDNDEFYITWNGLGLEAVE